MTTRRITVDEDGMTASSLVWGIYRSTAVGLVERFLELNPIIASLGTTIPRGTVVTVDVTPSSQSKSRQVIKLWD